MSDSSDVEIVGVIPATRIIDDIDLASSSSEDDDECGENSSKSTSKATLEKNRRFQQSVMFEFLQCVVLNNKPMVEAWSKQKTMMRAAEECQSLRTEGNKLKEEQEILIQENWKLKMRLANITKGNRKKLKHGVSPKKVPSLSPNICVKDNHKVLKDDLRVNQLEHANSETEASVRNENRPEHVIETPIPRPTSRVLKKCAGLSEEEKEFYKLEERIEHLSHEIDALWNDVKDEEEFFEETCSDSAGFESQSFSFNKPIKSEPLSPIKSVQKNKKENLIDKSTKLIENEFGFPRGVNSTNSVIINTTKPQSNLTNTLQNNTVSHSNDNVAAENEMKSKYNRNKSLSQLNKGNFKSKGKKAVNVNKTNSKVNVINNNKTKANHKSPILQGVSGTNKQAVKRRRYSINNADKTAAHVNIGYKKKNGSEMFVNSSHLSGGQVLSSTTYHLPSETSNILHQKPNERRNIISVTDINKLMKPQFAQKNVTSSVFDYSKQNDLSDDDSPRLVIDESPLPTNYYSELNSSKSVDIPSTSGGESYNGSSFIFIE